MQLATAQPGSAENAGRGKLFEQAIERQEHKGAHRRTRKDRQEAPLLVQEAVPEARRRNQPPSAGFSKEERDRSRAVLAEGAPAGPGTSRESAIAMTGHPASGLPDTSAAANLATVFAERLALSGRNVTATHLILDERNFTVRETVIAGGAGEALSITCFPSREQKDGGEQPPDSEALRRRLEARGIRIGSVSQDRE